MWDAKVFALDSQTVQSAFSRLLQCTALYQDARVFLFIDGLDEYEETLQDDFKAMVQLLLGWTQTAPQAVKLCVSSREENVFMNFFADDKRLRLQDLTLPDMRLYVQDKLQELNPDHLDRVIRVITEKANGIFLWVALVVKSIRARLEDGCGVDLIEAEVDSLPDELEGLFQHLLDTIAKSHRRMAYQTFAMLQESSEVGLSILAYSFLEEYNDDLEFAEKDQPCFSVATPSEIPQRVMVAHKKLNARCKGLAELQHNGYIIYYTHRSVVEFMVEQLQHRSGANAALANFQAADALSQLTLADIRSSPNDERWAYLPSYSEFWLTGLMSGLMKLRWNAGLDHAPFRYLQTLQVAVNATPCRSTWGPDNNVSRWYPTSVLHRAAWLGMHDFLDWMARTNSSVVANEDEISSLVYLSVSANAALNSGTQPVRYAGLFFLLRNVPGSESFKTTYPPYQTVWQSFIASAADAFPFPPFFGAGKILLEFLRRGVDLQVWFLLHHSKDAPPPRNWEIVIDFGSGATRGGCTLGPLAPDRDRRYYDFFVSKGGKVSLEDYIGFHDFEHKDAVLELLAQQRRASAAHLLPADPPSLPSPAQPAADDTAETDPDTAPAEVAGTEPKETAGLEDGASPDPEDTPCAAAEETASPEPQEGGPSKLVTLARKEPAQTGIRWLFKSRVVDALLGK